MTTRPDLKFRWICEIVDTHFKFLFQQGFCVVSVMFTDRSEEDWQVMLLMDDYFIRLRCDQGRISLGLSTLQLCGQVGFFDLNTVFRFTFGYDGLHDIPGTGWENEEQQIEEIARLFGKHSREIFKGFDVLGTRILDRVWIISKPNQNGQLPMDSYPFAV